jgi:hypothetical protein
MRGVAGGFAIWKTTGKYGRNGDEFSVSEFFVGKRGVIVANLIIVFLGALGVLAVKNLITARFAQDAKSAKEEVNFYFLS